jgi:hypothetical protein
MIFFADKVTAEGKKVLSAVLHTRVKIEIIFYLCQGSISDEK